MKTNTLKTLFGSLIIAGAFIATPVATFAAGATTTSSVRINGDGIVRVVNAEVTSISGALINAVTRFKNNVVAWTFTTNASTTIAVNNSITATSTAGINVGDRINVTGPLTALGSTISVTATKLRDITSTALFKVRTGTVQSINAGNGTFVLKTGDKLMTIQTNASTTYALGTSTPAFSSLALNAKVAVAGIVNAENTIITASKVTFLSIGTTIKNKIKSNNGASHGLKNGWKDKEDRDNEGEHTGFLKGALNLNLSTR